MLPLILTLVSAVLVVGQRPSFAGSRPIGYPELTDRTTSAEGLGNRFGEENGTTQRLPVEAHGDRDFVDRVSKLPIDKQPFWFINWQALEEQRKNPQTYPQRPSQFTEVHTNLNPIRADQESVVPQRPSQFTEVNTNLNPIRADQESAVPILNTDRFGSDTEKGVSDSDAIKPKPNKNKEGLNQDISNLNNPIKDSVNSGNIHSSFDEKYFTGSSNGNNDKHTSEIKKPGDAHKESAALNVMPVKPNYSNFYYNQKR